MELLTMRDAAGLLGQKTGDAARRLLLRHGVPMVSGGVRSGGVYLWLVDRAQVEALAQLLRAEALVEPGKRRRGRPSNVARVTSSPTASSAGAAGPSSAGDCPDSSEV